MAKKVNEEKVLISPDIRENVRDVLYLTVSHEKYLAFKENNRELMLKDFAKYWELVKEYESFYEKYHRHVKNMPVSDRVLAEKIIKNHVHKLGFTFEEVCKKFDVKYD